MSHPPPDDRAPARGLSAAPPRDAAWYARVLHAIGASSPDFTYVFDSDHRFLYVSPPLLQLWGRTLEQAVGKNFEELGYPRQLVELHERQLDEAFAGRTVSGSNPYVDKEGREGFYEYTFVPVRGEDGRVEAVAGTTRDVTARRQSERDRDATLARLAESEEQFRNFADAIPQLAWMAHADGFIFWYNRRWYEYTGTTPAQMEGWGWQSVHDPAELPRVMSAWKQSIENGTAFEMVFPLRAADGRFRRFLTRVNPVREASGKIVRWFGTNTDVEAQNQLLEERDAALAEAGKAIRVRDEFLSIASHELRTPLAALLLQIQTAQRLSERGQVEKVVERLQRAGSAASRLERLMTELLDVSRLAAGRLRLEPEKVDLTALVHDVCARFEGRTASAIRVLSDGPVVGWWDPVRLDQVITNLVDNAVKYGAQKPVDVSLQREGDRAVLRVRDDGIGIAPEEQRHVFDRFARASAARDYGGFGLGLWIAREIVEASGGRIELQSRPREGSTFTVTLPMGE